MHQLSTSYEESTLTLKFKDAPNANGTYYVTVTEEGKTESEKSVALTVKAYLPTKYTVKAASIENGSLAFYTTYNTETKEYANPVPNDGVVEGITVYVKATPNSGYKIFKVEESVKSSEYETLTPVDGVYSFTMPNAYVMIKATFEAISSDTTLKFDSQTDNVGFEIDNVNHTITVPAGTTVAGLTDKITVNDKNADSKVVAKTSDPVTTKDSYPQASTITPDSTALTTGDKVLVMAENETVVTYTITVTAPTPKTTTPTFTDTTAMLASADGQVVEFYLSAAIVDATWKVYDGENDRVVSTRAKVDRVDGTALALASVNDGALASGTYYVTATVGTNAESARVALTVYLAPSYLGDTTETQSSGRTRTVLATADLTNLSTTDYTTITFTSPETLYVFDATGKLYASKSLWATAVTEGYDIKLTTDETGKLSAQIKISEHGTPPSGPATITLFESLNDTTTTITVTEPEPSYLGATSNTKESQKITAVSATVDLANLTEDAFMPITFTNPSTLYVFDTTGKLYTSNSLGAASQSGGCVLELRTDENGMLIAKIKKGGIGELDSNSPVEISLLGAFITVTESTPATGLNLTMTVEGAEDGKTRLTIDGEGDRKYYRIVDSDPTAMYKRTKVSVATGWTEYTVATDVDVTAGQYIEAIGGYYWEDKLTVTTWGKSTAVQESDIAKEAATTFTVSGKVTAGDEVDASNLKEGLTVTLYKKDMESQGFDATQLTATTTKNETNDIEFSIADVPAGTYKAVIAADSGKYAESASAEFTVNDANVTSANIPLLPEGQGGSIDG